MPPEEQSPLAAVGRKPGWPREPPEPEQPEAARKPESGPGLVPEWAPGPEPLPLFRAPRSSDSHYRKGELRYRTSDKST